MCKITIFVSSKSKIIMSDNKGIYPPALEMNPKEPPSYFRGYLYYYDPNPSNTMHWVLYNGYDKMRFISRTALENHVLELQSRTPERVVGLLMRAQARCERAYQDIDEASKMLDLQRPELETLALVIRKKTDELDKLISQII